MSRPILTAAAMRAAEERAIAAGTSVETLMERAGAAVAEAAFRYGAGRPTLVLCGPGNNGGDGYVAARLLAERRVDVRLAATGEPRTDAAKEARARWTGLVETIDTVESMPILIDALFGTGLQRQLEPALAAALRAHADEAKLSIAADLPSGVATDDGVTLGDVPRFDITVALGALKPAHRLHPAAGLCGAVVTADIGVGTEAAWIELAPPRLPTPPAEAHKYSRGLVAVVAGDMPGAARLAARAAARSGAGMVRLYGAEAPADALVARDLSDLPAGLADDRLGAILLGVGMTDQKRAADLLADVMAAGRPAVLDASALRACRHVEALAGAILTPHEGEFAHVFGDLPGSKFERALAAARRSGAVIVLKGADTVIAAPDGRAAVTPPHSSWLSTAGAGDVLAGVIAAQRACGLDAFEAACAGVWLHAEAARRAGPAFIADDLIAHLPAAVASCL